MGFESPYDVDEAGQRAELQRRLLTEKCAWEAERESFVTDRTTLDNLTYTIFLERAPREVFAKWCERFARTPDHPTTRALEPLLHGRRS